MAKKEVKYKEGYTDSTWKSLAIKAVRVGWPQGIKKARDVLGKSKIRGVLIGQLFEDTFPVNYQGIDQAIDFIEKEDYVSLCRIATHHTRGFYNYGDWIWYVDLFVKWKDLSFQHEKESWRMLQYLRSNTNIGYVTPRVLCCIWLWFKINPQNGGERSILDKPYTGMPNNVMDMHTYEGKVKGQKLTLLSGLWENHLKFGERMRTEEGLENLREEFLSDVIPENKPPKNPSVNQASLF